MSEGYGHTHTVTTEVAHLWGQEGNAIQHDHAGGHIRHDHGHGQEAVAEGPVDPAAFPPEPAAPRSGLELELDQLREELARLKGGAPSA